MKFKLDEHAYKGKETFFKKQAKFVFANLLCEDYDFARKLEKDLNYDLSFYDCLHIAICKRSSFILVTRDSLLLKNAKKYIQAIMPEQFLSLP